MIGRTNANSILGTEVIRVYSGSISQSGTNVDLTGISGYEDLSMANFVCCINSIYRREVYMSSYKAYPSCSYNAKTGILTLRIGESNSYSNDSEQTGWEGSMTVYLIKDTDSIQTI